MSDALQRLTARLAKLATHYDIQGDWPEESIRHITEAGAWTWVIPRSFGGLGLDPVSQVQGYEAIGAGCMATLLILTQRDGACELINDSDNDALREAYLPKLCAHDVMTSVGISQLTTSHQTGKPALVAKPDGDGFRLHGFMPWVTAAEKCDFVVTGAMLPDETQILAIVPLDLEGVTIDPAMKLMAVESSRTSEVHCRDVHLEKNLVLRGPVENALRRRSAVKSLVVASAGVGLAGSMITQMAGYSEIAKDVFKEHAEELVARFQAIRERLYKLASQLTEPDVEIPKTELRVAVNDLLLRLAVGMMTFAKGSGFIRQRDAQRLVREAMFFLVWSAPEDVRANTLASFLDSPLPPSRSMST